MCVVSVFDWMNDRITNLCLVHGRPMKVLNTMSLKWSYENDIKCSDASIRSYTRLFFKPVAFQLCCEWHDIGTCYGNWFCCIRLHVESKSINMQWISGLSMKLLCLTWYLFIGVCTFHKKWLKNRISKVSNWCWMSALESQCWCDAIWKCNVCENMIETLFTANANGLFCEIRMTYPIQMFKWFSLCLVFLNANGTGTVLVLQIGITICFFSFVWFLE